jgi:hypothetical protein
LLQNIQVFFSHVHDLASTRDVNCPIWMKHRRPIPYIAYLHRHSLQHHGYGLPVSSRTVAQDNINCVHDVAPEMKINKCEVWRQWWPPDTSVSVIPLVGECDIKERCAPILLIMRRSDVLLEQDVSYLSVCCSWE